MINDDNNIVFCIWGDWINQTPKAPDNSFKEIFRNR